MVTNVPIPPTPTREGRARLVLESERLRIRRRAHARRATTVLVVGASLMAFGWLFLPHRAVTGLRHRYQFRWSDEQTVFVVAVLLVYLGAGACLGRWARVTSRTLGWFAAAAGTAVVVSAGACAFVLAVLDPEAGPERLERWFGPQRLTRPPAIGPEAVATLRPPLVVLLVLVLPSLLTATDSVLVRRDRIHLERLEDDVHLAAGRSAWPPVLPARPTVAAAEPGVRQHASIVRTLTSQGPWLGRRELDRQGRRARARNGTITWVLVLVAVTVLAVALPHGRGLGQPNLGTTVYLLATGFTAVATVLVLHAWARTRVASLRGLAAALLGATALASAGWWLTLRVVAGLRIRPEGLGYLRDPEVMADHDALYSAPLLVPQGSWQQAALLALPFVLPVVLAAWDARTARRELDRVRGLERLSP